MILTTRKMSRELLYLLALERRSILTSNDARKLKTLKRGYEGDHCKVEVGLRRFITRF